MSITPEQVGTPSPGSSAWGPPIWTKLGATMESIPCPKCRAGGTAGIHALHDLVNTKLGKPIHDAENLHRVRRYFDLADDVASGDAERDELLQAIADDINTRAAEVPCDSCTLVKPETTEPANTKLVATRKESRPLVPTESLPMAVLLGAGLLAVGAVGAAAFWPEIQNLLAKPQIG